MYHTSWLTICLQICFEGLSMNVGSGTHEPFCDAVLWFRHLPVPLGVSGSIPGAPPKHVTQRVLNDRKHIYFIAFSCNDYHMMSIHINAMLDLAMQNKS